MAGDLDYYAKWLEVPRWSNHSKPCGLCKATFKGPTTWLDNRQDSPWQASCLTTANWRSHWNPKCQLYSLPGFSGLCITMDYMHCMFLGWLQFFYGSVLCILVHNCLDGSILQNLQYIDSFIKKYQRDNETRYRFRQRLLKLTMIKPKKGYPKLRGRASDIQSLDTAILALFEELMDENIYQHKQVRLFLRLNLGYNFSEPLVKVKFLACLYNIVHTESPKKVKVLRASRRNAKECSAGGKTRSFWTPLWVHGLASGGSQKSLDTRLPDVPSPLQLASPLFCGGGEALQYYEQDPFRFAQSAAERVHPPWYGVVFQRRNDDAPGPDFMEVLFARCETLACFQEGCSQREASSVSAKQDWTTVKASPPSQVFLVRGFGFLTCIYTCDVHFPCGTYSFYF